MPQFRLIDSVSCCALRAVPITLLQCRAHMLVRRVDNIKPVAIDKLTSKDISTRTMNEVGGEVIGWELLQRERIFITVCAPRNGTL
jgi:hypothetical protein